MNIFFLSRHPVECAEQHCSKHAIKMPTEYGQMLSTAHRVLDGKPYIFETLTGRRLLRYRMEDPIREQALMQSSHVNHPLNKWIRASSANYSYLYELFVALSFEYNWRYGKDHGAYLRLTDWLEAPPKNIGQAEWTDPPQAMPEKYQVEGDAIQAYRKFYIFDKRRFAKWDGKVWNRSVPDWFQL